MSLQSNIQKAFHVFTWTLLLFNNQLYAQCNFVLNPDSESLDSLNERLIKEYVEIGLIKELEFACVKTLHWNENTEQSSHFSTQHAHSGNVYQLATFFFSYGKDVKIKILKAKLSMPMMKDSIYKIEFYIKPFSGNFLSETVDIGLTDSIHTTTYYVSPFDKKKSEVQYNFSPTHSFKMLNTDEYEKISFLHTAKGGERYLYIGNFRMGFPKKVKRVKQFGHWKNGVNALISTYAIDDVSVTALNSNIPCSTDSISQNDSAEFLIESITLKSVSFEFDSYNLNQYGISLLDSLLKNIQPFDIEKIEVYGYTDTVGTSDYNNELSLQRAMSVANEIVKKGVAIEKIHFEGKGETTCEGCNGEARRVEILLLRKK